VDRFEGRRSTHGCVSTGRLGGAEVGRERKGKFWTRGPSNQISLSDATKLNRIFFDKLNLVDTH